MIPGIGPVTDTNYFGASMSCGHLVGGRITGAIYRATYWAKVVKQLRMPRHC